MEPVLTKFIVGDTSFHSRGISRIKMTVDGEVKVVSVPIKSIGMVELRAELSRRAPKPKEKMVMIGKDTRTGLALGLEEDTPKLVLDYADEEYRKQIEAHQAEQTWRTLAYALDVQWVDKDGEPVKDMDRIVEAVKASGLTAHQVEQLLSDIADLTRRREAKADFLSGNA